MEKEKFDAGRFPREVYLGSELAGPDNSCARGQVKNYYGRFTSDSNFDNSYPAFKVEGSDGLSVTDCISQLNDRGAESLNSWLSRRLKDFRPKDGTLQSFRKTMNEMTEALNDHIRGVKNQKDKDGAPQSSPTPIPTSQSGQESIKEECKVMQQMTSALREVLSVT